MKMDYVKRVRVCPRNNHPMMRNMMAMQVSFRKKNLKLFCGVGVIPSSQQRTKASVAATPNKIPETTATNNAQLQNSLLEAFPPKHLER
jgi:hypothetical protein